MVGGALSKVKIRTLAKMRKGAAPEIQLPEKPNAHPALCRYLATSGY